MMLNKKGISIIELIVSIALMSVVMLFLYNLLSNVTFEKDDDFFASLNQANRIDLIGTIENDLICDSLVKLVSITSTSSGERLLLKGTKDYVITTEKSSSNYKITYFNGTDVQTWTIKGGTFGKIDCVSSGNGITETTVTQCTIPIYTTNINDKAGNNNTLDDIIFTFIKEV